MKDEQNTSDPDQSTHAGVVLRYIIRIALTYVALNGIDSMTADINNAYLQAPSSENHYIICGGAFGIEHIG